MKTCAACQTENPDGDKFCRKCGRAFDAGAPADATVRWTGGAIPLPAKVSPRRAFDVAALFGDKDRVVIGRAPDCDIVLHHALVSRYHALLEREPDGLRLRDLASVNGVSVAGARITEPVLIKEGERVGIGPFLFALRQGVVHSLDNSRSLRLEARDLEKVIPLGRGATRKLLDNINLVVNPGEFVSLLGPSGSGKSTLMDCLNGRRRATGGKVLANGEDFYRHFDNFRQSLGYVPQKDIVHTGLTVYRALYYTAQLRLPTDTDPAELHARIEAVIQEMELGPHRDTLVANLSGGQIKRVSLGAELLAQPCMLYIDEATSGLDAGTEARMMRLFRGLADQGRSIVCITHNVDNVDQCHLALVLARGKLIYYGPPAEAPKYFQVHRISEIYDRLSGKDVSEWEKEYQASSLHEEFVVRRLSAAPESMSAEFPLVPGDSPVKPAAPVRLPGFLAASGALVRPSQWKPLAHHFRELTSRVQLLALVRPVLDQWRQFRVLTARYVELIRGDRRGLRLLLMQAPIVAFFLLVGFHNINFNTQITFPRKIDDTERNALQVLAGLETNLAGNGELSDAQLKALEKVKFKVHFADDQPPVAGVNVPDTMDGAQVVALLRAFQESRTNSTDRFQAAQMALRLMGYPTLDPAALEKAEITMIGDEKTTVKFSQLREFYSKMHGLPQQMLDTGYLPDHKQADPRYTYMVTFIVTMIILWFGCNNAAKEIVKEEAIYGRERAVNLGIVPYLSSKFLVLSLITIVHALLLMGLFYGGLELQRLWDPPGSGVLSAPNPLYRLDYLGQFGVLSLLAMTGVAMGLLLSACVSTPDRANALLPYVLIPQLIMGGGFLTIRSGTALYFLAGVLSPVYWGYRAVHLGAPALPRESAAWLDYPDGVFWPCVGLAVQCVLMLLATAWFLKRKEA